MTITAEQYREMIANGRHPKEKTSLTENYNKTTKGWVEIDGKRCYCKSSWEMNWCHYLNMMKQNKVILDWEYEPETFWFKDIKRGTNNYTPDFKLIFPDGRVVFQEVKGYLDAKSKTKIKRMAKYHPDVILELVDKKRYRTIEKNVSPIIRAWIR